MNKAPRTKPRLRTAARQHPFAAAWSFTLIYCFYNAYFFDFASSPAVAAARNAGADAGLLNICLFAVAPGAALCFSSSWMRLARRTWPKSAMHICAFAAPMLLPQLKTPSAAYVLLILGAFCAGAIMGRALYTMIFMTIDIHPTRIIVAVYAVIQTYIHAYAIFPALSTLAFYYIVGAPTLLAGLIICFLYDGDDMERRRVLPEKALRMADVWPPLAVIVLAQVSFAFYETTLLPQIPAKPLDPVLQIIPNAVTLLVFFLLGRRMTLRGTLTVLSALFVCAATTFVAADEAGRPLVQMFTEPAFLCYDLYFFWLLQSIFRAYGRRLARLKLFVAADIAVAVSALIIARLTLPSVPQGLKYALLLLPPAFVLTLLIPRAERAVKLMEAQRDYADSREEIEAALPEQREEVVALRDALLRTLPPDITLDAEEQTALCYLIDGHDTDVTAHFMGISTRAARSLSAEVLDKFECKSKLELFSYIGAVKVEAGRRGLRTALFDQYGLTGREREICELLLTSIAQKYIGDKVSLSNDTVRFHTKNLYRKLNIQSRAELMSLFAEADSRVGKHDWDTT